MLFVTFEAKNDKNEQKKLHSSPFDLSSNLINRKLSIAPLRFQLDFQGNWGHWKRGEILDDEKEREVVGSLAVGVISFLFFPHVRSLFSRRPIPQKDNFYVF